MAIVVVGAGLAGCEVAWQAAERGVDVRLHEMRPGRRSPAHITDDFAELVCSNSLRSNAGTHAAGLLKEEMRRLGSLVLQAADETAVPAGTALAVDRDAFSRRIAVAPGSEVQEIVVQRGNERRLVHFWYRTSRSPHVVGELAHAWDRFLGRLTIGRALAGRGRGRPRRESSGLESPHGSEPLPQPAHPRHRRGRLPRLAYL